MTSTTAAIVRTAREQFGYDSLRPGQGAAIRAVLAGRDTLAVLPTGSGKSAIYQLAGLHLPGPTVVVSPLLALQRDQVQALEEQGITAAAEINSAIGATERRDALDGLARDDLEFLFLAPEQFGNEEVLTRLREAQPSLFVVDEAHCVSEWGHDFRPDYLRLGAVIEALGRPTILALTATAAPPVREEITARLSMRNPAVIVRGFDRPNIWLGVERYEDEAIKTRALLDRVAETPGPGIVYAATRRKAEELAAALQERDIQAAHYHAGMKAAERERVQDDFMAGRIAVIVATTAFGMGIDKPDVRFVFHHAISDALDAYYQEIGRSGRDGEPARAILFYRPEDLGLRRFFASSGQLDADEVEQVATAIQVLDGPLTLADLKEATGLSASKLTAALSRLEDADAVAILPTGEVEPRDLADDQRAIAEEVAQAQARHQEFDRSRIEMMRGYAETRACRRGYLLNYFGEEFASPCDACDNCLAGRVEEEALATGPFPLNSKVSHRAWGGGQVMRYEGEKIVILFDAVGYKTLDLALVTGEGLLTAGEAAPGA